MNLRWAFHGLVAPLTCLGCALTACSGHEKTDEDHDGYALPEDCDDTKSDVNPAQQEIPYNGDDDDCDDETRDDDLDGDGFLGSDDEDCDDEDAAVYPGAPEVCDGGDQDCDGEVDEEASDAQTFYQDSDDDGFGDADAPVTTCALEAGLSASADDCDDTLAAVNPGAAEAPYNGVDEDCDAETSDDDVDGDGYPLAEDCDDAEPSIFPGAEEICGDAVLEDCGLSTAEANEACGLGGEVSLGEAEAKITTTRPGRWVGYSLTGLGPNEDGSVQIVVGTPRATSGEYEVGGAYLFADSATGALDIDDAAGTLLGNQVSGQAGFAVADAGDADGNGYHDLLVGMLRDEAAGVDAGAVALVGGPIDAYVDLDHELKLTGESAYDFLGFDVAGVGDVNGDERDDFLVGAYGEDSLLEEHGELRNGGAAYLVLGPVTSSSGVGEAAAAALRCASGTCLTGTSLAGGRDLDGDGLPDMAVGAPSEDSAGVVHLVLGVAGGTPAMDDPEVSLHGTTSNDSTGSSVAEVDADGDGYADVLIGAYLSDRGGSDAGAAYLWPGSSFGAGVTLGAVSLGDAAYIVTGTSPYDYAGSSVAAAGDVDGDGLEDVLVGTPARDGISGVGEAMTDAGVAYLVLGPVSGNLDLSVAQLLAHGEQPGDNAGFAVEGAGDINRDGFADILVGAVKAGPADDEEGAAYLIYGGGF